MCGGVDEVNYAAEKYPPNARDLKARVTAEGCSHVNRSEARRDTTHLYNDTQQNEHRRQKKAHKTCRIAATQEGGNSGLLVLRFHYFNIARRLICVLYIISMSCHSLFNLTCGPVDTNLPPLLRPYP